MDATLRQFTHPVKAGIIAVKFSAGKPIGDRGRKAGITMTKRLILVTSPPASGKTYVSKKLAQNLKHVVYLDKDTLIVLSKQIFVAGKEEYNRSSPFFEKYIRDYEYMAIVDLALEALEYEDIALINAPFTREVRDPAYMDVLREKLRKRNARLTVVWVKADPELVHQRMVARNSDRDTWKLANWEQYIAGVDFSIPATLDDPAVADDLIVFQNDDEAAFAASMQRVVQLVEQEET